MPRRTKGRRKGKGTRKRRRRIQKGGVWYNPVSWNWTGKKPEGAGSIGTTSQSMTPTPTPSPDSKLASVDMCDKCKGLIKSGECKLDIESSTQAGIDGAASTAKSTLAGVVEGAKTAVKDAQKATGDAIRKAASAVEDADITDDKRLAEEAAMNKPMANPQSMGGRKRRKRRRKSTKKRKGKKKRKRTRRRRR